jgi:hypothetical protein
MSQKRFVLVIIDNYSHFTWIIYLVSKDETFEQFINFFTTVENNKSSKINTISSYHGKEFENTKFDNFYFKSEYRYEYFAPHTPQQNKVVERKNCTLQELVRTMFHEYSIPKFLWAEMVNTTHHMINRVSLHPLIKKIPYELWVGRKLYLSYFKVFGSKYFILNETPKRLLNLILNQLREFL